MSSNLEIICVVDDDITNLAVAKSNLAGIYDVITVQSGERLFFLLEKITPSIILLDIEMPDMNGYEVMARLQSQEKTRGYPVIFLTAKIDPESEIKGLNLGAVDYITKPFSRELLIKRVQMHILLEKQRKQLLQYTHTLEDEVDRKTRKVCELQNAILKTVAELVECRDSSTGGHIERIQYNLKVLVDALLEGGVYADELLSWDISLLIMSSQLHDVGKISIQDKILKSTTRLTDEEFEEMKNHALYGAEIIKKIESSTTESEFLSYASTLALSHHEKWDGSGYPYGLKGADIPLAGRIMAVVDVYDALTNVRPYKEAYSHEKAVNIIRSGRGTHFDPLITDVFLAQEHRFNAKTMNHNVLDDHQQELQKHLTGRRISDL